MGEQNTQQTLAERTQPRGHHQHWHKADIICGGFPCQDISNAGNRAGITGTRSGLWGYLSGAIRMVRPKYAIVENVAALLNNGMDTVLGDLAEGGYDAEWDCIPACAVGAPHQRDRVWIVANTTSKRQSGQRASIEPLCSKENRKTQTSIFESIRLNTKWAIEPDVGRVANGVPNRMDRLRVLGNAVVPQIATLLGQAILTHDNEKRVGSK